MLKLVIEGFDATGKSTLIDKLEKAFGLSTRKGEGPEKFPGEIDQRALRWLDDHGSKEFQIFDRHPCVSHPIYSQFTNVSPLNEAIRQRFYLKPSIIVYCRANKPAMEKHAVKEGESEEHVSTIQRYAKELCEDYDRWGLEHAHVIYDYKNPTRGATLFKLVGAIREQLF